MRRYEAQREIDRAHEERAAKMVRDDREIAKYTEAALNRSWGILRKNGYRYGLFRLHWWERIWNDVRLGFD